MLLSSMSEELPPVSLTLRFRACMNLGLRRRSVGLGLRERMLSESHCSGGVLSSLIFGAHEIPLHLCRGIVPPPTPTDSAIALHPNQAVFLNEGSMAARHEE